MHPRDRVVAYLKYMPSRDGKWGCSDRRYRRMMDAYTVPHVMSNVEMLKTKFPQYVFRSRTMNIVMSAVPRKYILSHYQPSSKLLGLMVSKNDALEKDVVDFVKILSCESGVEPRCFGVTGSILTGIHNPSFSDMDITVYGLENTAKVKRILLQEYGHKHSDIHRPEGKARRTMLQRWTQHYGLTQAESGWFAGRKWSRGFFRRRAFSMLPVHSPSELIRKYGDTVYRAEGIVEGEATIKDNKDSFFLPCTYGLEEVNIENSMSDVREITSYDGFYNDAFQVGDAIRFRGKLEKTIDRQKRQEAMRVLIGSPEARGLDYIRPVLI